MSDYLFLYREKDSDDRDCCAYIDAKNPRWECDHYFGKIILHGACYSNSNFCEYERIETILTESEYNELIEYDRAIRSLGYGIKKGDERYNKGIELSKNIQHIFDKLKSDEAIEFHNKIIESEIEYIKSEYSLSSEDIELIFVCYNLDYRDRGIIGCIFDNISDFGTSRTYFVLVLK